MTNLLDPIVLELQLQTDKFLKGQKELMDAFEKLAKILSKGGKDVEDQHKRTANSISSVTRELQSMFGLMKGNMAVEAANFLKDFAVNIANVTAGLGRMSVNIGLAPQALSAWQMVVQQHGGHAEDVNATARNVSNVIADFRTGKPISKEFFDLFAYAGMKAPDLSQRANLSTEQVMTSVMEAIQNASKTRDWQQANRLAQAFGVSESLVNTARETGDIPKLLSELTASLKNAVTPEQVTAAKNLQEHFAKLTNTMDALARAFSTAYSGGLIEALDGITNFIDHVRGKVENPAYDAPDSVVRRRYNLGLDRPSFIERNFSRPLNRAMDWIYGGTRSASPGASDQGESSDTAKSIASAIQQQEGYFPGSVSYRNNNPGNIKFGRLTKAYGATGADNQGHAIFPDYESGRRALEALLRSHQGESLAQIGGYGKGYAEDPNWAAGVSKFSGININQPLNFKAYSGAGLAASSWNASTVNNSTSNSTTLNGPINVTANDPGEFSVALQSYLKHRQLVASAQGLR